MKKYSSYFLLTHQLHLSLLLCVYPFSMLANPKYVFQSENPIANFAWNENDTSRYEGHYRYEQAYKMIEDMLSDKRSLDFAEAVFAVENCMYDGELNHSAYLAELERIASGVQRMAVSPAVSAPTPDVALNYALYLFYTQPCPLNNYHSYEYDKMSLIEDVGLTGGMVTNLLKTGMGTCHSLPYLYKIIADRVGAKAYIALAPLHLYIRHQDAEGKWWNYETTTGTYSRSSFIMESFHVNEKAIRSGLYMTNLTNKETVVQCLFDLLCIYERKTGFYSNDFVRKCYTLGLKYHYADNLHSRRIGDLEYQMKKKAWNKGFRSIAELQKDPVLGREYDYIQQQIKAYEEMGYYAYTQEEYMQKYQETLDYNRTTPVDDIRKWLSVDPLADKYPNISPYAYCNWNPVMLVDVTGKEPNKKLMGTSAEFRLLLDNSTRMVGTFKGEKAAEYMRNLSNYKITKFKFEPTQTGYFNNKKGRYIYTKKGGWIDMVHFLFYAGKAYKYKCSGQENPVETAISDGMMQEKMDQYISPHSAYSYEDLPTDAFGAYFGANYFDPNSNASLGEQVEKYLNEVLQATKPYFAPNFDALPKDDKSSSTPSKTNTTTTPVYTIE